MRQYERRKKEIACKRKWKTTNCNCEYSSETAPLFHGIWLTVPLATAHHFALCLSKFDFYLPISLRIPDQYLHGSRISFAFFILFRSQPSPNRLMLGKHFSLYTFSGQRIRKKMQHLRDDKLIRKSNYRMFSRKKNCENNRSSLSSLPLSLSLNMAHTKQRLRFLQTRRARIVWSSDFNKCAAYKFFTLYQLIRCVNWIINI